MFKIRTEVGYQNNDVNGDLRRINFNKGLITNALAIHDKCIF